MLQSLELPVVMNINPRSIYNKTEEFQILIEQYQADLIFISESWERANLPLEEILKLDNFQIISNVKQRDFKGGKPALMINKNKYYIKALCPEPITVPIGVECVWSLITPKNCSIKSKTKYIAVAAIYYRGPKSTKKQELFDHIAETFHFLSSKYGSSIQFIIAGDTNRLNLKPITNLSPNLEQLVKVPTRLNPDRVLDPIISTLGKWYNEPVTKPPINANPDNGKPSDHQVVLMHPLVSNLENPPRIYKTVVTRPLSHSGLVKFAEWIESESWNEVYRCTDAHEMAETFQNLVVGNYWRCFPEKSFKTCSDDEPWFSADLKKLDRQRRREFFKHKRSQKWVDMNKKFQEKCSIEKANYYEKIVSDLKESNPSKWYSKVKRMAGIDLHSQGNMIIDELIGLTDSEQSEVIANHYSKISNEFDPVDENEFIDYLKENRIKAPHVEPRKIDKVIKTMNKKAATIKGDIPMKLISEFSVELAFPLSYLINFIFESGTYPDIWKVEHVTPVPKFYPPEQLSDLRKISGLLNFSKIADKIMGEFIAEDMKSSRDQAQYGNEKNLSIQHYIIKMLHKILLSVDKNSQSEAFSVIIQMIDWSQAFDRQSHNLGVKSFIRNGVRNSLIPVLISFFKNRRMKVKWNGKVSSSKKLNGGGPQGGLMGILEYLSQSNNNADFVPEDQRFKIVDDLSILEIINLISVGLSCFNVKDQIPSDVATHNQFIPSKNLNSQQYLDNLSKWTEENQMKLNVKKSKYMVINFTRNYQFSTRLVLNGANLEEVKETKLLGLILRNDLKWHSNTEKLVKNAYKRMIILHNLTKFSLPLHEILQIYVLYIRSILENCAVVWHSSLSRGEELEIERVQKCALRLILGEQYSSYEDALDLTNLKSLKERRIDLCKNFARKCIATGKDDIFPLNKCKKNNRNTEKYQVEKANSTRLARSAVPYMQRILNLENLS